MVFAMIFAVAVAAFAVQNTVSVEISFLFWHFEGISLVLIILGSALLGATSVLMAGMIKQIKQSMRLKELEVENKQLKEELEALKEESKESNEKNSDEIQGGIPN